MSNSYDSYLNQQENYHHQQQQQKHLGGFFCSSQFQDHTTSPPPFTSNYSTSNFNQSSWRNYDQPTSEYLSRNHANFSQYESPPSNCNNNIIPSYQQLHQTHYDLVPIQTHYNIKQSSISSTSSSIHRPSLGEEQLDIKPRVFNTASPELINSPTLSNPNSFVASPVLLHPSLSPLSPPQTLGDLLKSRSFDSSTFQTTTTSTYNRFNTDEEGALHGCLPFIAKLRSLLADEDKFSDVLRWDTTGTLFIVHHNSARLKSTILPDTYGHANYPSFTRQLNIYGFRRLTSSQLSPLLELPESHINSITDYHGWIHPNFLRNCPHLSAELKPRTSFARRILKEEKEKKAKALKDKERGGRGFREADEVNR